MERVDDAAWRRSSRSGANGGNCLEAANIDQAVVIRDSKQEGMYNRDMLAFTSAAWQTFTRKLKTSYPA